MTDVEVSDLTAVGLVLDVPGYQLPPEAFTVATNMQATLDGWQKGPSWAQVLDTDTVDPLWIFSVRDGASSWLLYGDLASVYAWDQQNAAADISGTTYTTYTGAHWNGCLLAGTPILSNGAEAPQYWSTLNTAQPLQDLPNWTSDLGANSFCKAIRAFAPYLVALSPTIAGTPYPHGVLWSHPADPGTMPASWDYTDPERDAGLVELADADAGGVQDGLQLRDQFIVYKTTSTHRMRQVGGEYIMQIDPFLSTSGILANRCVALTGDGRYHFVATTDDIIVHDGASVLSVVDKKVRRTIFNAIDSSYYYNSFVFSNPTKREMYFAYPENGSEFPTRALIWNYGTGANGGIVSETEFTGVGATLADLLDISRTWADLTETWDELTNVWDVSTRNQVVFASGATGNRLSVFDQSGKRNTAAYTGTLTREGLSIIGRRRSGEPIVDFRSRKFVRRIWPKVEGGPVYVRLGYTDTVAGTVTWAAQKLFDPSTMMYVDFALSGRTAPCVEFSFASSQTTRIYGYTIEVTRAGRF